jgi:hypothetical protein
MRGILLEFIDQGNGPPLAENLLFLKSPLLLLASSLPLLPMDPTKYLLEDFQPILMRLKSKRFSPLLAL